MLLKKLLGVESVRVESDDTWCCACIFLEMTKKFGCVLVCARIMCAHSTKDVCADSDSCFMHDPSTGTHLSSAPDTINPCLSPPRGCAVQHKSLTDGDGNAEKYAIKLFVARILHTLLPCPAIPLGWVWHPCRCRELTLRHFFAVGTGDYHAVKCNFNKSRGRCGRLRAHLQTNAAFFGGGVVSERALDCEDVVVGLLSFVFHSALSSSQKDPIPIGRVVGVRFHKSLVFPH